MLCQTCFVSNLLAGIIAGVLSAVIVLFLKKPALKFDVGETHETGTGFRILRAKVTNRPLDWFLARIYGRDPALMCLAWIYFYYNDEKAVHPGKFMVGRWEKTPLPIKQVSTHQWIPDSFSIRDWVDISPDSSERLDLVCRFEGEPFCYGWNNESYDYADLKNDIWKLDKVRYYIYVKIKTGGNIFDTAYELINEIHPRLEIITDKNLIKRLRQNSL